MSDQDRNLPASQRKLDKARSEGQVPRSRDLGHFAALAVGGAVLVAGAPQISDHMSKLLVRGLKFNAVSVQNTDFMTERLSELSVQMMLFIVPLGVLMSVVAAAMAIASGGWVWTFKTIAPKFDKFNPLTGVTRLFSKQQLTDTLKASVLALILGSIGAFYLRANIESFGGALSLQLPSALSHAGSTIVGGLMLLLLALALFAVVDVPLQKMMHANQLKMSHQEVKQEHKEVEGNPEIKAKARARARELASKRMLQAIPNADLVVMNPTHYAVALKYDEAKMGAPRVVAKGADLLAMKIRDIAKESQVPVLQAPPLARALYAHAELDREIPAALFSAVAQVLAYVYQLRAAMAGRAKMPNSLPDLNVPPELDPHNKPGFEADKGAR